jgi:hypothetical protein
LLDFKHRVHAFRWNVNEALKVDYEGRSLPIENYNFDLLARFAIAIDNHCSFNRIAIGKVFTKEVNP